MCGSPFIGSDGWAIAATAPAISKAVAAVMAIGSDMRPLFCPELDRLVLTCNELDCPVLCVKAKLGS